ncbi:ABC transporter substrate-binding protein [Clostridium oryzae]|uniref:DUF3502 domain-containing protein n=1 Tax=Clostridium oryzae TaxID=1450648 RepID=A0A1V4J0U4_9CLOT|nr:ABC transporter substrate-binding protein [Clostridium oryzae]OPJ65267.1 hypothetical protein CLORY_02670 [Clostridium oryzae]
MLRRKKILTVVLTVIMTASLSACKAATNGGSDSKGKIDTSKFVTVNYVMLGNKPTNGQNEKVEKKWNAYLKKKLNANLKIDWVEWADWSTKYNLLLASGQSLDLIITASDWLDMWPNAQKGAFMNLDDLLPKYAPKTYASIPKEDWEQCKYNGKIIAIPEDQYTQWTNHGFMYRGDWAKEFGITTPIKDWTTFGKYLQGIKDHKKGVIPWDIAGGGYSQFGGWVNSKTMEIPIDGIPATCNLQALLNAKSADDPYTVVNPFNEETLIDYAKTMKQWGDAGYWRQDVLNYKGDSLTQAKAGKNGTIQHHTQTYLGDWYQMKQNQPSSDLKFFPFSAESNNLVSISITHGATSVGASSKNPERALMIYDLIRNDKKMYDYVNYGLEGVQYVLKDGKRALPDGYNDAKDSYSSGFWGGRNDKLEIQSATTYPDYKKLYAEYDKIKKPYPYGRFVFDKTNVDSELSACSDVISKYLPAISFGKAGDPVKAVSDFRAKLKGAGIDKIVAEAQKQLNAYKKLVEGK